jgi:hypothetical protein
MWYSLVLLTTPVNPVAACAPMTVSTYWHATRNPAAGAVVLVIIAWFEDAPMVVFIVVWGLGFLSQPVHDRWFAELHGKLQTPLWQGFRWHDLREQESGFWRFIGVVYWQTNVDLIPTHLSTLLAGNLLGPAAAGLFRLARETSSILTQPAVTLREVLFPDLTRAWNARETNFSQLAFKTALIAGSAGLVAAFAYVAGTPILAPVGADYVPVNLSWSCCYCRLFRSGQRVVAGRGLCHGTRCPLLRAQPARHSCLRRVVSTCSPAILVSLVPAWRPFAPCC